MTAPERTMRTPLGRVRHHGASGGGTSHVIAQRATAIALILLGLWFVIAVALEVPDTTFLSARDFLSQPLNAVGVILLVAIGLYHMSIGMQEVIVDYILKPSTKVVLLILNAFVPLVLGVAAIFAVLRLNFGA
jgi:succinate dehydrogenase / fumarate reductase membrane anchor subunit